jgi:hypothetical protein
MTRRMAMRIIVLPQAVNVALPGMAKFAISLLKDKSRPDHRHDPLQDYALRELYPVVINRSGRHTPCHYRLHGNCIQSNRHNSSILNTVVHNKNLGTTS